MKRRNFLRLIGVSIAATFVPVKLFAEKKSSREDLGYTLNHTNIGTKTIVVPVLDDNGLLLDQNNVARNGIGKEPYNFPKLIGGWKGSVIYDMKSIPPGLKFKECIVKANNGETWVYWDSRMGGEAPIIRNEKTKYVAIDLNSGIEQDPPDTYGRFSLMTR